MNDTVIIEDFRERRANTLRGFLTVRLPSGLVLHDVTLHQGEDGCWVGMPSKPMLDADGNVVRDERGRIRYVNLINFSTRARRNALSQQILAAVQAKYPEALKP